MVGVICAFGGVFVSMILEGGNPASVLAPAALILIIVGSFGAAAGGVKLEHAIDALKALGKAFGNVPEDGPEVIERLAGYAERARRDGLLALEKSIPEEPDPFLSMGLQLVVDGAPVADTRNAMALELHAGKKIWKRRAAFYSKLGGYSPTFGIIGTVLGLIHTLEQLGGDPSELGHLIAAAFIATLWGVLFANALFLPIGTKLTSIGEAVAERQLLILEGVCGIAEGLSPRQIRAQVSLHLPPEVRQSELKRSA